MADLMTLSRQICDCVILCGTGTEQKFRAKKNTVIRQDSIHKHCTQDRPNNLSVAEQHIFLRKVKK